MSSDPFDHLPALNTGGSWDSLLAPPLQASLEALLPAYLQRQRWFAGKARPIRTLKIEEAIPFSAADGESAAHLVLVLVGYDESDHELYLLPLTCCGRERAQSLLAEGPTAAVARIEGGGPGESVLFDAVWDKAFCSVLLERISARVRVSSASGELRGTSSGAFFRMPSAEVATLNPSLLQGEQSNSSIIYGSRLILKLYRRLTLGIHPEVEMGRFLTDRAAFPQTPPLVGALELLRPRGENITLAIVQGFAANQGDAWRMTLQHLRQLYSEIARSMADGATPLPVAPREGLVTLALEDNGAPPPPLPPAAAESFAAFLGSARLLGQRTAELHLALASDAEDPDFAPEPFSAEQRVALEASLTRQVDHVLPLLEENLSRIEEGLRAEARQVLDRSALVRQRLQQLRDRPMTACCIRCHGDYHLGQVLFADDDFLIIDFEGEPARPLAERRRKRPALADVAGMIRSFHYAAHAALFEGNLLETRPECEAALEVWAGHWYLVTASTFLGAYLRRAAGAPFLPAGRAELQPLLETFLLEKAVYELGYELNNRLSWVRIPLRGILGLLG